MSEHEPYLRKVAAGSLFNTLTSAVATALLLPLVIRQAGMDTYGLWAVLGIFIGVTSLLDLGILKSLVYLSARAQYTISELLSSAVLVSMSSASLFALLLIGLLIARVPVFGGLVESEPGLKWWLAGCGCVVIYTSLLTNLARGVLEAAFRGHWVNIGYGLLTLLQYTVAVIIAHWTHNVQALILGSACVYTAVLLLHLALLKALPQLHLQRPSSSAMKSVCRVGLKSFLADLPIILIGPLLSYLFVQAAASAGEFGVFDLALRIATLASTALGMLSTPFFVIVAAAPAGQHGSVRQLLWRQLRMTLLLGSGGWLLFLVAGPAIVAVIFPDHPAEIHRAALIMLSGTALVAALEPITRMLMGLGQLLRLALLRVFMLSTALLVLALLGQQPPLQRFAAACGLGYWALALGLLWLNQTERWGRNAASGI